MPEKGGTQKKRKKKKGPFLRSQAMYPVLAALPARTKEREGKNQKGRERRQRVSYYHLVRPAGLITKGRKKGKGETLGFGAFRRKKKKRKKKEGEGGHVGSGFSHA